MECRFVYGVRTFWSAFLLLTILGGSSDASSLRRSAIVRAVQSSSPAIVNIDGQKTLSKTYSRSSESQRVKGMGTGVFVDHRGYILTNYHVVQGVRRINVKLSNGTSTVARLIANDPVTDLAIIKIRMGRAAPLMRIGTSKDLMTGEEVIAIGNAYGYQHTVTRGIISALHRNVQVDEKQKYFDLIQTDASINPGNSGGPLLNIDGELIGINVAVRMGAQGIGFAIPVDTAMAVAAQLLSARRISGISHGIVPEDEQINQKGIKALTITSGSPASTAGVKTGDLITEVNGFHVMHALDLERAFIGTKPGQVVTVALTREGHAKKLKMRLQPTSKTSAENSVEESAWQHLGLRLRPLDNSEVKQFQELVKKGDNSGFRFTGGMRVVSVRTGSGAAKQGIRTGDVLVGLHKWKTMDFDNVGYILEEPNVASRSSINFYIVRGGDTFMGNLPVTWR